MTILKSFHFFVQNKGINSIFFGQFSFHLSFCLHYRHFSVVPLMGFCPLSSSNYLFNRGQFQRNSSFPFFRKKMFIYLLLIFIENNSLLFPLLFLYIANNIQQQLEEQRQQQQHYHYSFQFVEYFVFSWPWWLFIHKIGRSALPVLTKYGL